MKEIELTQGYKAIVDDADYEWLNQWKWHYANGYAMRQKYPPGLRQPEIIFMARLVMGCVKGDGVHVDHISGETLNNQRKNLRKTTTLNNIQNQKRRSTNKSGYKGVHWYKTTNRWIACITQNYQRHHLGYFHSLEDAARAYDRAAIELHGEFARLNFPRSDYEATV